MRRRTSLIGLIVVVTLLLFGKANLSLALNGPANQTPQNQPPASSGDYDSTGRSGLVQCGNKAGDPCTVEDIFNLFVIATNLLIGVVGLVAIYSIVFSGYYMIVAAGNVETITSAKKNLTNAIIGLILVLLAFIFINLILYGVLGITGSNKDIFNPLEYIGLVSGK